MEQTKSKAVTKSSKKARPVVTHSFVVEFRKYTTELTSKYLNRKPWVPPDENNVLSFIPGTISKIYIKQGQEIQEGEPMLILEAMKMKNTLYASRPGKVLRINVSEGEQVPKSKVLIEMQHD